MKNSIEHHVEVENRTPFMPFHFESIDQEFNHFGAIVLKGTFDIVHNAPLKLNPKQDPISFEDEYYGEPNFSSLRLANSLSPFKSKTDVVFEATAYSPSHRQEESWSVTVEIGGLFKQLSVTGPRFWRKRYNSFELSKIQPISSLDLRFEKSFGGRKGNEENQRFHKNPVGLGYFDSNIINQVQCPQILPSALRDPIWGQIIESVGLGPIAPSWEPRITHAGKYDITWQTERAPYLPSDFSYDFYNIAPLDQQINEFARGDEFIRLTNLTESRKLNFQLPSVKLFSLMKLDDGRIVPGPVMLDTIECFLEKKKVYIHWRGIFPRELPIRKVEILMSAPSEMIQF